MTPEEYFPELYRQDVEVFWRGMEHPSRGPWWMLCGRTLERLLGPGEREKYIDPELFLYALWLLSLTQQNIRMYSSGDCYEQWILLSESFPDLRGCHYAHGNVNSPDSLLQFARDPSYIPRAKPLMLDEARARAFVHFFFHQYLGQLMQPDPDSGRAFSPAEMLERLRNDPGCPELARYA